MYELLFMLFWGFFFLHRLRFFFHSPPTDKKKLTSSINVPCHALFYLLLLLYTRYFFLLVVIPHTDLIHSLSDWLTFLYKLLLAYFSENGDHVHQCLIVYFAMASCIRLAVNQSTPGIFVEYWWWQSEMRTCQPVIITTLPWFSFD